MFNDEMHRPDAGNGGQRENPFSNLDKLKFRDSFNLEPASEAEAIKMGYQKVSFSKSILHKLGGPSSWNNVKYVHPAGYEAVYNNGILVSGINAGTYNIVPQTRSNIGHTAWDVLPFFVGY